MFNEDTSVGLFLKSYEFEDHCLLLEDLGLIFYLSHFFVFLLFSFLFFFPQDDGLPENEHQLSVAGKIKKHFNTGPKPNSTAAGVSVIAVSI